MKRAQCGCGCGLAAVIAYWLLWLLGDGASSSLSVSRRSVYSERQAMQPLQNAAPTKQAAELVALVLEDVTQKINSFSTSKKLTKTTPYESKKFIDIKSALNHGMGRHWSHFMMC